MSGHSKWHNIQKTKGAQDAKRAQAFTKIAREMIVAVKEGGSGDPNTNSRLAAVIAKAKAANMPNDNIKRTIDKALGSGNTDNYESITYEGYGPSGVAIIVETMTDNRNRTASEVRHYFDKYGGNMGATGCVSWSFDKKGVIVINDEDQELEEDKVMGGLFDPDAGLVIPRSQTVAGKLVDAAEKSGKLQLKIDNQTEQAVSDLLVLAVANSCQSESRNSGFISFRMFFSEV